MSTSSILIIEDEAIIAADLAGKVQQLGYALAGATTTGEEAIALARQQRPALVLMDIHLAGAMDGITAANIIRQECDVPVIFLTAHSDRATVARAQEAAFGYILKPFDERDLRIQIEMALFKHAAERRLRDSEARLTAFAEATFEGIVASEAGRIVDCNEQLARMLGYSVAELRGMEIAQLLPPEDRERIMANIQQNQTSSVEHAMLCKNGTQIVVEAHDRLLLQDGARRHTTLRDITERKRAEQELRWMNQALRALSNSNQALMRAHAEQELLDEVCRIIVNDCGHAMVWIGYAENDAAKTVRPVASAGAEDGYLNILRISWADTERGRGPTGTAIRTGRPSQCTVMLRDPNFAPWRAEALKRGYAASLVLPLLHDGKAFGALTIYSRLTAGFSEDMVKLLNELANDLAHGIMTIRLREAHRQAEAALLRAKEEWERTFDAVPDLIAIMDNQHRIVRANRSMAERLGLTPEQCHGRPCYTCVHGTAVPPALCPHTATRADGRTHITEIHEERLGGHFLVSTTPLYDEQHRQFGSVHVARDITARKRAEAALQQLNATLEQRVAARTEALQKSEERFRQMAENVQEVFWLADSRLKRMIYISPRFEEVWGHRCQELYDHPQLWFEAIHPDDRQRVQAAFLQRRTKGTSLTAEYRVIRPNGTVRWIRDQGSPVYDKLGRVYRIAGVARDVTERKQAEEALEQAYHHLKTETDQRQQLERQILEISEREQRRIGDDLHDSLGQQLAAVKIMSGTLARRLTKQQHSSASDAAQIEHELQRAIEDTRQIARGLHPVRSGAESLMSALHELANGITMRTKIACRFECPGVAVHDHHAAIHLFRIAQEAVNNAIRHAQAKHIWIRLRQTNAGIQLSITDDGCGLPKATRSEGLGLRTMRYRASVIGATFAMVPRRGGGTRIICCWNASETKGKDVNHVP